MENIKSLLKEHTEEIKRHTDGLEKKFERHMDVLKEDFDSKVALIVEQYASIRKILDSQTKKLDVHSETLASHSVMLTSIKEERRY
ncbi:MAG: hypothetical protein QMC93_00480 [Patescibacteria group bacterium]|nr:hypothetical protein [Patescibacteria group bacterium]